MAKTNCFASLSIGAHCLLHANEVARSFAVKNKQLTLRNRSTTIRTIHSSQQNTQVIKNTCHSFLRSYLFCMCSVNGWTFITVVLA